VKKVVVRVAELPPKEVSPNYHGKLRPKISAIGAWRDLVYYCARAACLPGGPPGFERALVRVTFQVPSQAYIKDDDNAMASMKPAVDGCVLAGIVVDDSPAHLSWLQVVWDVDKTKDKATILEFIKKEVGK